MANKVSACLAALVLMSFVGCGSGDLPTAREKGGSVPEVAAPAAEPEKTPQGIEIAPLAAPGAPSTAAGRD